MNLYFYVDLLLQQNVYMLIFFLDIFCGWSSRIFNTKTSNSTEIKKKKKEEDAFWILIF